MANWNDKSSLGFEIAIVVMVFMIGALILASFMLVFRPDLLIVTVLLLGLLALALIAYYAINYHYWSAGKNQIQNF